MLPISFSQGVFSMSSYRREEGKKRKSLPKSAKAILFDWLRKNVNNPYPSEEVKANLVALTGLTLIQVNNWFINSRRRALKTWTVTKPENQQLETCSFLPVDGASQDFTQSVDSTSRNPLGLSNMNLEILCCAARFVEFRNSLMEQTSTRWDMENVP
ncbi:pknox1 [Trichonephila clavata]|uniref:Pknox1 n=1 Tax=Trichonephila clavata TaxID=2740835 RepID=A0A8X6FVI9_TRICU|nr:pknox1 [Trichonephila clavata]